MEKCKHINTITFITEKNILKKLQSDKLEYIVFNKMKPDNILICEEELEYECTIEELIFDQTSSGLLEKARLKIKELEKELKIIKKENNKLNNQK